MGITKIFSPLPLMCGYFIAKYNLLEHPLAQQAWMDLKLYVAYLVY